MLSQRLFIGLVLFTVIFSYGKISYQNPYLPDSTGVYRVKGALLFEIDSLSLTQSHFGYQWFYKGKGKKFIPDSKKEGGDGGKNFPCCLSLPKNPGIDRPLANSAYIIYGTLKKTSQGGYQFQVDKEIPWKAVKGSWSLAEFRYKAKSRVKNWIKNKFFDPRNAEFLGGIMTGEFEDRVMRGEFGRQGLLHIMAISGFHFAIVAAILQAILRMFLPPGVMIACLAGLMSLYFVFLGCSPSIVRAWVMSLIVIMSMLAQRPSVGLNALGISILVILFLDPQILLSLGFQFSAITTAAILVWYPAADQMLTRLWPKRPLAQIIRMHFLDKHSYLIVSSFRQTIALALAVNLVAIPAMLYFFHKFPLMSFFYNLFIPFLVGISMFLLLIGGLFDLVLPFIGTFFHAINAAFTHFMLSAVYNLPANLSVFWRVASFSSVLLVLLQCLIFSSGILLRAYQAQQKDSLE